jgi:RHS repeat-associated protein
LKPSSTKRTDAETGIIYFGYRFYLPNEGRWLNRDPIEEMGSLNLYQYVKNNPVGFVDPLGLKGLAGFGGRGADAAKAIGDAIDQGICGWWPGDKDCLRVCVEWECCNENTGKPYRIGNGKAWASKENYDPEDDGGCKCTRICIKGDWGCIMNSGPGFPTE